MHFVPVVGWWSQLRTAINLTLLVLCSQVANRRKTFARNCCGKGTVTIEIRRIESARRSTDLYDLDLFGQEVPVLSVIATKSIRFAC